MTPYAGDWVFIAIVGLGCIVTLVWEVADIRASNRDAARKQLRRQMREVEELLDSVDAKAFIRSFYPMTSIQKDIREAALSTLGDIEDYMEVDHNGLETIVSRLGV